MSLGRREAHNSQGHFKKKLKQILYSSIEAVHVICPNSFLYEISSCNPRSLLQNTKPRDIARVILIKGSSIYENVQVLTGTCPTCQTLYVHEQVKESNNEYSRMYLNAAKYFKVGKSLWVDCVFSYAIVNGMYSFYASTSTYTNFWNNSFSNINLENSKIDKFGKHLFMNLLRLLLASQELILSVFYASLLRQYKENEVYGANFD